MSSSVFFFFFFFFLLISKTLRRKRFLVVSRHGSFQKEHPRLEVSSVGEADSFDNIPGGEGEGKMCRMIVVRDEPDQLLVFLLAEAFFGRVSWRHA